MEPQNVSIFAILSRSFMLSWNPPLIGEQNGILLRYHVIVIETQIHYADNGTEITGMQRYLNRTYNVSEGRAQLIDSLHPDYNYTVRIAAATEPGIGPFSDAITVMTDMDGKSLHTFFIKFVCPFLNFIPTFDYVGDFYLYISNLTIA